MKLARPVIHPDRQDLLLLGEGHVLDAPLVTHLVTNGISHVWIAFPGLEELDCQISKKVSQSHYQLFDVLNRSIDTLERRVQVKTNISHYKRAVHQMLAEIIDDPFHDLITHQLKLCGPRLAGHQANCAYLALLVGAHLSGYLRAQRRALPPDVAENTAQLGLGALLHDVGKVAMPEDMRNACILDPQADWPEYQYHTQCGYQEVREHVSPVAANVVLHHHQRFDGKGFPAVAKSFRPEPEPLSEHRIHVFSRIVAVVDAFDHLLCPGGKQVPAIVAIAQLRSDRFRGWFDPVIVEALLRLVPPFMVGQIVRLNDGRQAVIIANHPESPCRPTLRPISGDIDDPASRADARPLDLRMSRSLTIETIDGVDVRPYLYTGDFEPSSQLAA
jgi:HD-GYP domain-containing protein (c-di-GMP phosphodiesterase class II)